MNKLTNRITNAIIATLFLSLAGTAMAQDGMGEHTRKGQHHRRADHQMPVVEHMMRAVYHLDLSDEQSANIRIIMQGLKTQERSRMKEMKSIQTQLKALIKADTFDEPAVAALAGKEGDMAAVRLLNTSRAMSQVYAQLTDTQRAELETMAEERQARRAERREQRNTES